MSHSVTSKRMLGMRTIDYLRNPSSQSNRIELSHQIALLAGKVRTGAYFE